MGWFAALRAFSITTDNNNNNVAVEEQFVVVMTLVGQIPTSPSMKRRDLRFQ